MRTVIKSLGVLVFAITMLIGGQVWGQDSDAKQGKQLDIQLQLDNETITLNGESLVVEKPYLDNGTTLVPLRVITAAFGAILTWDSKTQTVGLKYGTQMMQLVIGSGEATVDGTTVTLPTAPQLKNGTTMVPLRFISETFGASVSFNEENSKIAFTATQKETNVSGTSIEADSGKTHIGNSFYGWSMKYPSGLVKNNQSFKEDRIVFNDAKGEYQIAVNVIEDQSENLSKDAILKKLANIINDRETLLDKKYVEEIGQSYARIITKDTKGVYEYRGYSGNERFYLVLFTVLKEEDYKNPTKNKSYKDLLDSFKTSFDPKDTALKDLSSVKDGYRLYTNTDYGITVNVPTDWSKNSSGNNLTFFNKDQTQTFSIRMTSAVEGDTVEAWVARESKLYAEDLLPEYRRPAVTKDIVIAGVSAKDVRQTFTLDGVKWNYGDSLFLFKGKYKYEFNFSFDKMEFPEPLVNAVVNSIVFSNSGPDSALGTIQDDKDFVDKTKKTIIKNKSLHYAIDLPEYWTAAANNNDADQLRYNASFGIFSLYASKELTVDQLVKASENAMTSSGENSDHFKILDTKVVTMFGVSVKKYSYEQKANGIPLISTSYIFNKNNISYGFDISVLKVANSDENLKQMNDALNSFRFLE